MRVKGSFKILDIITNCFSDRLNQFTCLSVAMRIPVLSHLSSTESSLSWTKHSLVLNSSYK